MFNYGHAMCHWCVGSTQVIPIKQLDARVPFAYTMAECLAKCQPAGEGTAL